MYVGETKRLFLTYTVIIFIVHIPWVHLFRGGERCVQLGVTQCQDLNYSSTLMPNVKMSVDTMAEVTRRISEFSPLFKIGCYKNLKFFICNMFMPVCELVDGEPLVVYPCRHVCEEARAGCEHLMNKYNFQWPEVLRCPQLEDVRTNHRALCGRPPPVQPSTETPTEITRPGGRNMHVPHWMDMITKFPQNSAWIDYLYQEDIWKAFAKEFGFSAKMEQSKRAKKVCDKNSNLIYVKKERNEYCPQRCEANTIFTETNKKFATVWISTWSVICFLSTLLTVCTFLIDHKRFKYPERPIIFLSFCYNLYSIGYLVRVFSGYERIICESSTYGKHVVIEGMTVTSCTLVFFFLYFFGMASALWWVVLSITWFLSAALKWGHEAIEKYSSLFHAVSWSIPTIQTIAALVKRKVDADKLSGMCFIGNERSEDLLLFVAIPLILYLLIGTFFLMMGFVALIRIRKVLRRQRNTSKFERLMIRIGIFSVLYSLPASIVVGCFLQEYNRLKLSEEKAGEFVDCIGDHKCAESFQPRVELMYLRYFMLLVVGVTSGVWIWTSKTLNSWKKFTRGGRNRKPDETANLYKRKFVNDNAGRPSINRFDSADNASHVPSLIVGTQFQHPMYPATARYYYPVVKKTADYIPSMSQNETESTRLDNDKDKKSVFVAKQDDVVSTQSSKPYSGTSECHSNHRIAQTNQIPS